MFPSRILVFFCALLGLLLSLAACGSNQSIAGKVQVVATENFWGSIAAQVGGSHVHVTSILTDPNADPHSYEPQSDDAKMIADAQYVIVNGAGYDPWADKLLQTNSRSSAQKVLDIGKLNHKVEGDNPHMWYNPDYVENVVYKIRNDLKTIDPADAIAFDQSAQSFLAIKLKQYHLLIAAIKAKYSGVPVGATESIFSYLASALGLNLITPYSYLKAVSESQDISASDEATVEQQIKQKQIKILLYNTQNTPNNIQKLISLAKAHHIPTPMITETLAPANLTFEDWQSKQLQGIQTALARATGR